MDKPDKIWINPFHDGDFSWGDSDVEDGEFPYLLATPERELASELVEALRNVMGHVDTPIARRKLGIKDPHPEWIIEARAVLAKLEGKG